MERHGLRRYSRRRTTSFECTAASDCASTPTCDCFRHSNGLDAAPCEHSFSCAIDGGVVGCQFDYP